MNEVLINPWWGTMYVGLLLISVLIALIGYLHFFHWYEIKRSEVPRWVQKAADNYENKCGIRPYGVIKHFKGRSFLYRIWYECLGQGQIKRHYYRKHRLF